MHREYKKIIVRMPNWLGDLVMATPVLADLRKQFPHASITAMCLEKVAPLLYANPHIDELFSFTRPSIFSYREISRHLIARLRQGKYDLGILLTNSFSSAYWFWRGKVEERLGFRSDGRAIFLTKPLQVPQERGKEHLVETYKRVLLPLGIRDTTSAPELFITATERAAVRSLLKEYQIPKEHKVIGFNPLAAYGAAKCWPADRFRELALRFSKEKDVTLIFFGEPASALQVKDIVHGIAPNVISLAGMTSLREFMAWLEILDLFVTNDSGPMHIAAALKTPLLALFGSTNAVATGPYKQGTVIHKHVACSPCYLRTCPIDFRCMKQISVEEVFCAMQKILNT